MCVPLYFVSKLARDSGTIVVQSGEGSDEIFHGYDWYVRLTHTAELLVRQTGAVNVT